jgi:hypothetical protein
MEKYEGRCCRGVHLWLLCIFTWNLKTFMLLNGPVKNMKFTAVCAVGSSGLKNFMLVVLRAR